MRRTDKELTREQALSIVKNCTYGVLCTLNADGSPYGLPISPALDGDAIYFHGFRSGLKLENLNRDNRVCLTCVGQTEIISADFNTEFESAIVYGTAELLTDDGERTRGLLAICEKYSKDHMADFDGILKKEGSHTSVCKLTIKSVTGKATPQFKEKA